MARVYCENEGAKLFWHISYLKSLSNVSIPLRGKGYEKQEKEQVLQEAKAEEWFPSPCGEKVMKNPILTETLLHLAFKGHLRQATETKM
ncbi:hypothetical protein H5968_21480 [Sphaerospermopsis sp. LEGE 00249]|uniref:hypothetical protein n=1 Tax=Sphaerospermopsis sp. LEGE 00249 TaxID=1380707 RepID=UPI00164D19D8|nr:hypothetical protein [Sphaerospermopsis sp. LEGE 00249]MBC5797649.1 hypothetical protein [Sphaerospermopsis sp. LEGE 00249]